MEEYHQPLSAYLPNHPSITGGLVVSAVIIHTSPNHAPRTLVIQRALKDGFPLKWETPGGGVENSDRSIVSAAVREVQEETGLVVDVARDILGVVGGFAEWEEPKTGLWWRKVVFLVGIMGDELPVVRLEAREHRDWRWVTEEEVREGGIEFAYGELQKGILEGFGRVRGLGG
ncbi:NUDIX hydrolase domain-like protein [Cercophora samala]|uniref:NUDIX hydrolase domain-like protein n=1 Tax=Cercophora samala TaxID=330535 RepID=A0AA39ZL79_9PEZI|nr:NUDIX hydrolase domain-like protein [Cercophora samala]